MSNGWDDCSIDEAYRLFRGRVWNVHVKERVLSPDEQRALLAAGGETRRRPALLGAGALPWSHVIELLERDGYRGLYTIETHTGRRGTYGWQKLRAVTTYYMYALRELLEEAEAAGAPAAEDAARGPQTTAPAPAELVSGDRA